MSDSSTRTLIPGQRSLIGHLVGSSTGAANDNFFRIAFTAAVQVLAPDDAEQLKPLLGLLFIIPMLLLAPTAGSLGDRLRPRGIMLWVRGMELPLVVLGGVALWLGNIPLMMLTLAGFGLQTAFFSPVKYGCLPDIVDSKHLAQGNGALQAATSLAILVGTALVFLLDPNIRAGTWLSDWDQGLILGLLGGCLAMVGVIATWMIRPIPAHNPTTKIATPFDIPKQFRSLSQQAGLWGPTLALAAFWALGSVGQLVIIGVTMGTFGFKEGGVAVLSLLLGLGSIIGGLSAGRILVDSAPRALAVSGAFIAGGGFAMACLSATGAATIVIDNQLAWPQRWLAAATPEVYAFAWWLLVTGIGGGWWMVSCNTILQRRAALETRCLAYSGINVMTNLGIIFGFVALLTAPSLGLTEVEAGTVMGGLTAIGAAVALAIYRLDMARWLFSLTCRTIWRVRLHDVHHLPRSGGCVLVVNHQSFADGPLLTACLPRPTRPLVHAHYVTPLLRPILEAGGCLSINPKGGRGLVATMDRAAKAAAAGEVVVVFAEGKISRGGDLDRFHSGAMRIASRAQVPMIPVRIDGLQGSLLARSAWRDRWRLQRRVDIRLGAPLATDTSPAAVRQAVQNLGHQHARERLQASTMTLGRAALACTRRQPFALAVADITGSRSRLALSAGAMALTPHLNLAADENRVGVLLPPGAAGSAIIMSLAISGRTAVPLNHTVGQQGLERMAKMAGLRTIISARAYHDRIGKPALPGRVVMLEDVRPRIGSWSVLWRMLAIMFLPHRLLDAGKPNDDAAIIFSSGSTGDPKGVRLSHRALLANAQATVQHFALNRGGEALLTPLPLFHSFGLSIGTWLPLCHGVRIIAHADPLDARTLGRLAKQYQPSFLVSTPTFVRGWMRRMEPEDLAGLKFAVVGAEACPRKLQEDFYKRYGAPLLEGYGATELGPVVAAGTPDRAEELGSRPGSVGRPITGVEVLTLDPESKEVLPVGETGLLLVRSPALMSGYLDRPDLTKEACILDGYNTGDIGRVDDQGFIYLHGRLARFAKIGGEMVPLDRIEELLSKYLSAHYPEPEDGWALAVAPVPDPDKGERLVMLYASELPISIEDLLSNALAEESPLWRPRPAFCYAVEEIPVLGTGKRDLAGLKALAEQCYHDNKD